MKKIALPQKIEFNKGKSLNQCSIVVGPCYPGYGITLGNSLRRVLLSSLPGAAVIGVKIKGADHEFKALQHIKEDILEIVLNLKKLSLKVHSNEVIALELDVAGEKKVKAGDINKNSEVEIINSDLTLANITDMAGNLNMKIFVSTGNGYEMVESREKNEKHEIGYIEIDSIFTPVLSVGVEVENVRVGKMTNWDKLILNITTDGSITPEEAFKKSAEILIEQFGALTGSGVKDEKEDAAAEDIAEKEDTEKEEKDKSDETETKEAPKKKKGRPKKI